MIVVMATDKLHLCPTSARAVSLIEQPPSSADKYSGHTLTVAGGQLSWRSIHARRFFLLRNNSFTLTMRGK